MVPDVTGLLYRRGDCASLASIVASGLADEDSRKRMGAAARRVARDLYNVDVMAERFVEMARLAGASGWASAGRAEKVGGGAA
jgi:glycosyltransferase involved in cell wall biosynthesis